MVQRMPGIYSVRTAKEFIPSFNGEATAFRVRGTLILCSGSQSINTTNLQQTATNTAICIVVAAAQQEERSVLFYPLGAQIPSIRSWNTVSYYTYCCATVRFSSIQIKRARSLIKRNDARILSVPLLELPLYYYYFFSSSLSLSSSTRRFYSQRSSGQKPWSQVSGVVPSPRCVPSFFSRIGFSIPTARRFSSNECCQLTLFLALSDNQFLCKKKSLRSVRIELTKLILVGTRITYKATGDGY